ncbi:MAG: hypothetical protein HY319_25835 [Armatimonadetes bacterium]|nr:hypothetical protein [Armatimonadota bacterium]
MLWTLNVEMSAASSRVHTPAATCLQITAFNSPGSWVLFIVSLLSSRRRSVGEFQPARRSVFSGAVYFLLHVWNRRSCAFSLADTIGWDRNHLAALAAWATGEATGEPGHYF